MIYIILLIFIFPVSNAQIFNNSFSDWLIWKKNYNNNDINNDNNDNYRYDIFKNNIIYINEINSQNLSFKLSPSVFANLTFEEYKLYLDFNTCSYKKLLNIHSTGLKKSNLTYYYENKTDYSYLFDNNSNNLNNLNNWIYTLQTMIFAIYKLLSNNLDDNLNNNNINNNLDNINVIKKNISNCNINKIESSVNNLYNKDINFYTEKSSFSLKITNYLSTTSENILLKNIQTQPLLIYYDANDRNLQFYSSGIYNNSNICNSVSNIGILVGYDFNNDNLANPSYWKIKNSWTHLWGENGYFRFFKEHMINSTCETVLLTNTINKSNILSYNSAYQLQLIILGVISFVIIALIIASIILYYKTKTINL